MDTKQRRSSTDVKMDSLGIPYTLQSNASKKLFPNNKASHFFVKLPAEMELTPDYAVAMTEFHFSLMFDGVREKYEIVEPARYKRAAPITNQDDEFIGPLPAKNPFLQGSVGSIDPQRLIPQKDINVKPSCVSDATRVRNTVVDDFTEVLDSCKAAILDLQSNSKKEKDQSRADLEASFHERQKISRDLKACQDVKRDEIKKYQEKLQTQVNANKFLADNLKGCNEQNEDEVNKNHELLRVQRNALEDERKNSEFWRNSYVSFTQQVLQNSVSVNTPNVPRYLYIYCDIVKKRCLGDTFANYLHVSRVPPIRIAGDTAVDRPHKPTYCRLAQHRFDQIEIVIRDERGKDVLFEDDAISIISLHFKRIR